MVAWSVLRFARPELAGGGRDLLYQHGVGLGFLATVRRDGGPRLHPICPLLTADELFAFINRSPKQADLRRAGRYALHSFPCEDNEDAVSVSGYARLEEHPSTRSGDRNPRTPTAPDGSLGGTVVAAPVGVRDSQALALLKALTSELAGSGHPADQTFGYSPEQLERGDVYLVGARVGGQLVGIGGVELQSGDTGELKRLYVVPEHRGTGVADTLTAALLDHGKAHHADVLRLETGDKQKAAIAFYRRHGFV